MVDSLPNGYSFIKAGNQHMETAKSIVFGVLEEYGLIPDHPELDDDLNDIDYHYENGYFGLIINELGKKVGTFALYKLDDQTAEIRKMYLLPEARGKGIGKWMLNFLTKKARDLGFKKIELTSASPLIEAIQLYKKSGFTETESAKNEPRCDKAFFKLL